MSVIYLTSFYVSNFYILTLIYIYIYKCHLLLHIEINKVYVLNSCIPLINIGGSLSTIKLLKENDEVTAVFYGKL